MMHTIVDLNEVAAEPERRNTEDKIDKTGKNVLAFDAMRTILFNGN